MNYYQVQLVIMSPQPSYIANVGGIAMNEEQTVNVLLYYLNSKAPYFDRIIIRKANIGGW